MKHVMDVLTSVYEAFGTPYPKLSLLIVCLLGALTFGVVWVFLGKQVEQQVQVPPPPPTIQVTGPANAGDSGIANSGNGNKITNSATPAKKRKKD